MLSDNNEMDMRHKLGVIDKTFTSKGNRSTSRSQGHLPTSNDIENNKVKSLANRLKAGSYKETLTNILEWQDRNIVFWIERWTISRVFVVSFSLAVAFVVPFIIVPNSQILSWIIAILASSAVTTFFILVVLLKYARKTSIWEGLKNLFAESISMDFLLENKLGICRDYAKLTACLLSNVYPNAEIYFSFARDHIATGIMIQGRLYMLDQHLPILTIDKWDNRRHLKKIERFTRNGPKKVSINSFLSTTKPLSLDIKRIAVTMTKLLNIEEQSDDGTISLEIPWKKGVKLYEENEMVDYSLARYLETKISSELMRINQITRIEISRHKDDLRFLIRFSQSK
jgi:hypothetical protein